MNTDEFYMKRAIELAEKGKGRVNPNPLVGAVIVKDNKIIGEGYHEKYGGYHAERNALINCMCDTKGAVLYVNLEPCCHFGKTPPCTDIIIEKGIKRVVIGCVDDNPLVGGKGINILRENGIDVSVGVLEEECRKLNYIFFHFIKHKTPFVIMKFAMTIDGKIASYTGKSKWITNDLSRKNVHLTRNEVSAVMTGIGTVIADNPILNCRIEGGNNPMRVICDSHLNIPEDSEIVKTSDKIKTFCAVTNGYDIQKAERLNKFGVNIISVDEKGGKIDLKKLIVKLGEINIDSILIEGGSELNFSAVENNIADKIQLYIAPKILGGRNSKTPVGGIGFDSPDNAFNYKFSDMKMFDDDIMIEYERRCL